MFNNPRYVTRGVSEGIPIEMQIFMWSAIDNMIVKSKDYLQVFKLSSKNVDGMNIQHVKHSQEQPVYEKEYDLNLRNADNVVNAVTIFCIDDGDHSTMLLSSEY